MCEWLQDVAGCMGTAMGQTGVGAGEGARRLVETSDTSLSKCLKHLDNLIYWGQGQGK